MTETATEGTDEDVVVGILAVTAEGSAPTLMLVAVEGIRFEALVKLDAGSVVSCVTVTVEAGKVM